MQFSVDDAQIILNVISTFTIPFVTIWITKITWRGWQKFAVVLVLSFLVGLLKSYISGDLSSASSIVRNTSVVLAASQSAYHAFFQYLGLHKVLYPTTALIEEAKQQVARQLENVSSTDAKDALDPVTPSSLQVSAEVDTSANHD